MKNRKPWTSDEITKLRQMYDERASLKQIARMLSRSYLSVNKALDRYRIRNSWTQVEALKKTKKCVSEKKIINVKAKADPFLVEISTVILNLCGQGHTVTSTKSVTYPYLLNDVPKTEMQLLLECNRYRYNHKLPVYRMLASYEEE